MYIMWPEPPHVATAQVVTLTTSPFSCGGKEETHRPDKRSEVHMTRYGTVIGASEAARKETRRFSAYSIWTYDPIAG
jgi:hypothetical protein